MKKASLFILPILSILLLCCQKLNGISEITPELKQQRAKTFKTVPVKISKEIAQKLEQIYNTKRKQEVQVRVNSLEKKMTSTDNPQGFGSVTYDFANDGYAMTTYDDVNQTYYTSYFVNQTGYDVQNNPVNYTVFFLPSTYSGLVPIVVQTQSLSLQTYSESFYDTDNTLIMQIGITDGLLSSVTPGIIPESNSFKSFFKGWGSCFLDVYSNHGGASALALLASAYVPPTAGYFALRCAAENISLW